MEFSATNKNLKGRCVNHLGPHPKMASLSYYLGNLPFALPTWDVGRDILQFVLHSYSFKFCRTRYPCCLVFLILCRYKGERDIYKYLIFHLDLLHLLLVKALINLRSWVTLQFMFQVSDFRQKKRHQS